VSDAEAVPFQITHGGAAYDEISRLPVVLLLDNFRSLYNVGSLFRTADGAAAEQILLCGFTGTPPQNGIAKTALGAEKMVPWAHYRTGLEAAIEYRERGYEVAVVETSVRSVDLFDWVPRFPVCLAFGNELHGISADLLETADTHVRIPMLGAKHSLNVATAAGIVVYELLRKYRSLVERLRCGPCA
jgi:23S rRNA (guanosine2251-2'-O)-methyltransferase